MPTPVSGFLQPTTISTGSTKSVPIGLGTHRSTRDSAWTARAQTHNVNLGDTKTFSSSSVNEFRLGYFRLDTLFNQPQGGKGVTLASLGFASGANGAPGIVPLVPALEGVPEIDFNDFVIGVPSRPNGLIDNIYQVVDNYSRIVGTHTLKFGGQYHYDQLEEDLIDNVSNGNFFFGSNFNGQPSETGNDFVDFLLGCAKFVRAGPVLSFVRPKLLSWACTRKIAGA